MSGVIAARTDEGTAADQVLTFLFTDIEGSSARWEQFPSAMVDAVARHDRLLAESVAVAGGTVVKSMGDGIYAVFGQANAALAAAMRMQQALVGADFDAVDGLRVRIALHHGPATVRDGDYFGPSLNRTARLIGLGHGGQIVASEAVVAAVDEGDLAEGVGFQDLGRHRLRDLLAPERVFQLVGPGLERAFPPLRSLDAQANNLPIQASAFIGRESEIEELRGLIGGHRLVTLVGTGGIGKTRLALQAGAERLGDFADGVWLVELARLSSAVEVVPFVASLFNVVLTGGMPASQLAGALRDRKALVIFDNCEHLVEPVAALVGELLARCPGLRLLATSRVALHVPGECCFAVPALALPVSAKGLNAAAAAEFSAIRLFVDRAGLAMAGSALDDTTAPEIAEICIRLDGLALAIELAAARIRMLRPGELLARLNDRFRLLTAGARTAMPRHQTLRALHDWSFELLGEAERVALRRLGVFVGSFTIAGAEAVVAGDGIAREDVFDLLATLLDNSLIVRLPQADAESRFRLLETTRAYALERLAQADEAERVQKRLVAHMVAVFGAARDEWPDMDTELWRARYALEQENLRAALEWTLRPDSDTHLTIALAARLLAPTRYGWINRSQQGAAVQAALTRLAPDIPIEDEAWIRYVASSGQVVGYSTDQDSAERALALFRQMGDAGGIVDAAVQLATTLAARDPDAAARYVEEAMALLPALPENLTKCHIFILLVGFSAISGDYQAAREQGRRALAIAERFRASNMISLIRGNAAVIDMYLEDYQSAMEAARLNAVGARARQEQGSLMLALWSMAACGVLTDDLMSARQAACEALAIMVGPVHDMAHCADVLIIVAQMAARLGALDDAAMLGGFSQAFWAQHPGSPSVPLGRIRDMLMNDLTRAADDGTLSETARTRLMATGATLSSNQAVDLARNILGVSRP